MTEAYDFVNQAWKSTSKILFGQEIGELEEFESYLKGAAIGRSTHSSLSGKPVWVVSDQYAKNARFFDYAKEHERFDKVAAQPFDINRIKDIDSLVETLRETFVYSGNKALGNSKHVEHSDAVVDGTGILNSSIIFGSKYVAYSFLMRENEYCFGATSSGQSHHIIRCFYNNTLKRCFECCTSIGTSDCYFSYNLLQCTDCIFSFNLRAKRYLVGNVQLNKDQYNGLKTKLLAEFVDELKKSKKLKFSIMDLMNGA